MIPKYNVLHKTHPESLRSELHRSKLEKKYNAKYRTFLNSKESSCHCPHCSNSECICYGVFNKRLVIVSDPLLLPEHSFVILKVQRYLCKNCKHTFSIMPENCAAFLSLSLVELTKILREGFDALHVLSMHVVSRLKRKYAEWCSSHDSEDPVWALMMDIHQHRLKRHRYKDMKKSPCIMKEVPHVTAE